MKTTTNTEKNAAGKPSLYSANGTGPDTRQVSGILGTLEPRPDKPGPRWQAVFFGVVILLAAAMYLGGEDFEVRGYPSPAVDGKAALHRTDGMEDLSVSSIAVPMSFHDVQTGAATIIADASLHDALLQVAEATDHPAASMAASGTQPDPEATRSVNSAAHAPPAAATSPALKSSLDEQTVKEKAALHMKRAENRPIRHGAFGPAINADYDKDGDVDLIAALLRHVSRGGMPKKEPTPQTGSTTSESRAAAEASGLWHKRPATNHDVVARDPGETMAELVKRCRALGFMEGELCRLRVCSGLWGADPACPGRSAAVADLH